MSTRCNILVDDGTEVVQYYHHHDGYPEAVGMELFAMAKVAVLMNGHSYDEECNRIYDAAGLKKSLTGLMDAADDGAYENEGAVGKGGDLHGDIEYLYEVTVTARGIGIRYSHDGGASVPLDVYVEKHGD